MTNPSLGQVRVKPCPFCGAHAAVYHAFPEFDEGWHVACEHEADCILAQAHGMMSCEATDAAMAGVWNRRASLDLSPAELKEEGAASVDGFVAAVCALADAGIESDIQEVLVRGNPARNIKPNALLNAIEAYNRSASPSKPEEGLTSRLAAWFNALPDEGMGKEHFDALLAIVGSAPVPEPQAVATGSDLCALFEHAVTQQTNAYEFRAAATPGTWMFRCSDWIDLTAILRDVVAAPLSGGGKVTEALKRAERALKPFSDKVYNDNGDMTIETSLPDTECYIAAYFALKAVIAALATMGGTRP